MTTINDINDLARILRENPDWANTLRTLLLTEDLLDLPRRLDEFTQSTNEQFQHLGGRLDKLDERLEASTAALTGRMDNGFGAAYKLKVERNIHSLAGQHLGLRSVQILRGAMIPLDGRLREECEQAEDLGAITAQQLTELWAADLIILGGDRESVLAVHAVIEASITIGDHDINRAADRGETLSSVREGSTVSAVIGARIDQARLDLAKARGVQVLQMSEEY